MSTRAVIHYPHTHLRQSAATVTIFDTPELHALLKDMIATMHKLRGIGLAATQIDIHERIAVIGLNDGPLVLINPEIRNPSKDFAVDEEGCLSVPGVFGFVNRHASLQLRAYNAEGKRYDLKARGLFARVIQHEVDHLNGKLYIDRCHQLTTGLDEARKLKLRIPPLDA